MFQEAGSFSPSALTYAAYIDSLVVDKGVQCNPHQDPRPSTGWPARCLLPCVQYAVLDEPYFNGTITTDILGLTHRPLCPCTNSSVYLTDREYNGSTGAHMSE